MTRVLVIGAGTGGLCLAHGLRRAGIEVEVFERDRTRSDGLHGYRVGIDPDGSRALAACLPPELFDTFVATCARAPRYFSMLTERLGETLALDLRPPTDPIESEKSVSRMTLRQVLLTGLEDVVRFGARFTEYEQTADGVTARFEDGTTATGDLLVAADGTRSRVRAQYLPQARIEDTGIIGITAKVPIDDDTRNLLPPKVFEGISMVFAPRGFSCILHVMEFPWDRSGELKHGIGGNDAELIAGWPGLLYDNTRDYINWGLAAAADKLPADVMSRRGTALMELARELTPGWHPNLHRLFERADPGSVFPLNIATSVPVEPWAPSNVTLLGDAIHTMTPGRGVGANTALRDAALLVRQLERVRDGELGLVEAVGRYEAEMVPYGFQRVRDSLRQINSSDPIHRPVIGRAVLAGMRTGMRLVNHLPPAKRRMTDSLYRYRGAEE